MDLKKYYSVWNDGWKFFRQYAEQLPQTDEGWNKLVTAVGEFSEKHGSTFPAIKMAALIYSALENEYKHGSDRTT